MYHFFNEFLNGMSDHIRDDDHKRVALTRREVTCKICKERYPNWWQRLLGQRK